MNTTNWNEPPLATAPPDFGNLLAVLSRSVPDRPTLFEFFLNPPLYARIARRAACPGGADVPSDEAADAGDAETLGEREPELEEYLTTIAAFRNAGYDYVTIKVPGFEFATGEVKQESTRSLNEGAVIRDRNSLQTYEWPDPDTADYGFIDRAAAHLPAGMKLIVWGPCGVLENAIALVGYENLCYMLADDEAVARQVFDEVGLRLVRYYEHCLTHDSVGAVIGNDDWGFKSQTMLPPDRMRELVFPWHARIVDVAHSAGRPAILHSCGNLDRVMDDVIDVMKYDAKHSYEDSIQPVESAYEQYHDRIAILGGIDMDFVCRSTPDAVYERSRRMLAKTKRTGGYALGTGNSVPEYVPDENYFALLRAAGRK